MPLWARQAVQAARNTSFQLGHLDCRLREPNAYIRLSSHLPNTILFFFHHQPTKQSHLHYFKPTQHSNHFHNPSHQPKWIPSRTLPTTSVTRSRVGFQLSPPAPEHISDIFTTADTDISFSQALPPLLPRRPTRTLPRTPTRASALGKLHHLSPTAIIRH